MVVEADDELVAGEDEFEGRGVVNLPKEAGFKLSPGGRDFLLKFRDFWEVSFTFWVEFFELGLLGREDGFELAFSGQVEALEFVEGVEVGFALGDDDAGGVVEGGEAFAGGGVGKAELFVAFALVGWARDESVVFGEEAEGAAGLFDGAGGFAVGLGEGDGRGAALGDIESVAAGEDGTLKGDAGVFGEVELLGGGGVEAPKVGFLPGEEGGREVSAIFLNGHAGANRPGGDEFAVAGDEAVGGGDALFPKGGSGEGIGAVDEAIV